MKKETPYVMLLKEARDTILSILSPKRRLMCVYEKQEIERGSYSINTALYERVEAARQLGYEVHLVPKHGDLHVHYVERRKELDELPIRYRWQFFRGEL